ncbi:MAG: hypothetical protein F6K10_06040 [Moorea sp. SIO2B7]|nr:hypothetical protein [Moorena sp. SIO2B7]
MVNTNANQRLAEIVDVMLKMTQVDNTEELLYELVEGAATLTTDCRIEVMLLDHFTGELIVKIFKSPKRLIVCNPKVPDDRCTKLEHYSGISGLALKKEKPVRVNDIVNSEYNKIYLKRCEETCSEIALPLLINGIKIRVKTKVETGSKVIGVLNIESPYNNAFSPEIEEQLQLLARHFTILYDRREYDKKIAVIRQIEPRLANEYNYENILQIIVKTLYEKLDFKFVNISLIEGNCIKSKYVEGIKNKDLTKEFKEMAIHHLDSTDIQADIVRKKIIEVIEGDDPRFDDDIFDKFDHKDLIRLFLPMIDSFTNKVIGTVEVGYPKQYRKHIYEQDIQILLNFVNYAVRALERKKSALIDRITHEFRSPIAGIRSHASFLERRFEELDKTLIKRKLNDIITDCEILLYQVSELDYFLRRKQHHKPTLKKTFILRNVIIKTINQLKPILVEHKFSPDSIRYKKSWSSIFIYRINLGLIRLFIIF